MDTSFDIVMRENDFVLYANGNPMLSNLGNEVSHSNARLLRLAITHEMFMPKLKITPLTLLSRFADVTARSVEVFGFDIDEIIKDDPLLLKGQIGSVDPMDEFLLDNSPFIDFIFFNSSSFISSFNNFLLQKDEGLSLSDFLIQSIRELTIEQQLVLNALCYENGGGLSIHLLLLKGFLSLTEYSAGLFILKLKKHQHETIDSLKLNKEKALAEFQQQIISDTQVVLDFLILCKSENKISVIEEIVKRGEDNQTEFKSTLRWDIRQEKKNPAIEHAVLKTICAFLNSEGGDLLIGVRDDGSIEGIETDRFGNDDCFLLHIWTLIKTCMGQEVVEWVKTSLQKFGDKTVCRVSCRKAKKPVFLNQNGFDEAFYVRVGPSSSSLDISSALKYIEQHF